MTSMHSVPLAGPVVFAKTGLWDPGLLRCSSALTALATTPAAALQGPTTCTCTGWGQKTGTHSDPDI